MLGSKIGALFAHWKTTSALGPSVLSSTPVCLLAMGALFFANGCMMTKAQGEKLTYQMRELEDEVAKLQRVRHDMEVLLVGQVRDLVDRIARLESQLISLRASLTEGSSRNTEMVAEIQNLRGELEQAQYRFKNLEQNQQDLAKHRATIKDAQNIRIPPQKEEHFALAKKSYIGGKYDDAATLFEQFIKSYPDDKELVGQSYYSLGEIYRNLGAGGKSESETEKFYKKSVVSYQRVIEDHKESMLREEALFKIGSVLKAMGNKEGAIMAYKELLAQHSKGKRVQEAKKQLAELQKKSK